VVFGASPNALLLERRSAPAKSLSACTATAIIRTVSVLELKKEVARLSNAERLQAMEWLWASLSREEQDIESPEWHGEVLAARQAKVDSGEAEFFTVDQLKDRLRR
jgi:hypothetical protein